MKKIAIVLLAAMLVLMFCACEETPSETDGNMTLDNLDWSFEVEGGSMDKYTYADAQKHELAKTTTTVMMLVASFGGSNAGQITTFVTNGVSLTDFLADIGKPDATEITYSGRNCFKEEVSYTVNIADIKKPEKVVFGWMMNKKILTNTDTYVGLFFDSSSTNEGILSLTKVSVK